MNIPRSVSGLLYVVLLSLGCHSPSKNQVAPGGYDVSDTLHAPEENRLTKTMLVKGGFFEPTEMTILPNLDILVVQRRGEIMLYKHDTKTIRQVGFLNAYWKKYKSKDMVEEGVLGLQADPDFASNHFIYIYYSPLDTSVNRLSRFTFSNDTVDNKSEKIVLQLYSQREMCCHTGGSIAFGNDHQLFLSAGDNTNPFDEPHTRYPSSGYGPMDDRPGHEQYDARRSSGNTNDLRGKIMRIKILPDGSYAIPDGNLFPKNEPKARPEIYVMGDRNPYRITVDKTTGYLYWGEVGPDAQTDSPDTRGSRGYDEVNQARQAGYFGWPLFVGHNYPYRKHNYATGVNGPLFDPQKPVNESRNNTGLRNLPPAQPAFIWYPYAESPDFPETGSGGRCAMAGPVYHSALYPEETRMPAYYNGKLFIYDWTRGWFKLVTMKPNGDYERMEAFMKHTRFNAPCDVEMGPDGKLYILEYGNGWYAKNADAGLSRIDFNAGNRPPVIDSFAVDKKSGALPFTVKASVKATDPENSALTYRWDLGDGTKLTGGRSIEHTYTKPGEYAITVEAADPENAASQADAIAVYAGNEAPVVSVRIDGNRTFYFPGSPVRYAVTISDKDDTAAVKDLNDLVVTADYKQGDEDAPPQGDQFVSEIIQGKNLMLSNDCKTCHKVGEPSIGPAFQKVAAKYAAKPDEMLSYLTRKIRNGGSGTWGEASMPAHPSLKDDELKLIIGWIQSLAAGKSASLPAIGQLDPTLHKTPKDEFLLTISASYTDKGGNGIRALSGSNRAVLRNNLVYLDHLKQMSGYAKLSMTGNGYLAVPTKPGWCKLDPIDLTDVKTIAIAAQWSGGLKDMYVFRLHIDSENGPEIGAFTFPEAGPDAKAGMPVQAITGRPYQQLITFTPNQVKDGKLHSLYIVSEPQGAVNPAAKLGLWWIRFNDK